MWVLQSDGWPDEKSTILTGCKVYNYRTDVTVRFERKSFTDQVCERDIEKHACHGHQDPLPLQVIGAQRHTCVKADKCCQTCQDIQQQGPLHGHSGGQENCKVTCNVQTLIVLVHPLKPRKQGKLCKWHYPLLNLPFLFLSFSFPPLHLYRLYLPIFAKKEKKKENYSGWSLNRVKRTLSSTHPTHAAARGRQRPRTYTGRAARSERRPHQSPARPPGCVWRHQPLSSTPSAPRSLQCHIPKALSCVISIKHKNTI